MAEGLERPGICGFISVRRVGPTTTSNHPLPGQVRISWLPISFCFALPSGVQDRYSFCPYSTAPGRALTVGLIWWNERPEMFWGGGQSYVSHDALQLPVPYSPSTVIHHKGARGQSLHLQPAKKWG